MIPRFIIKNPTPALITQLNSLGYDGDISFTDFSGNMQAIGTVLMEAAPLEKNKLYKIFAANDPELLEQAKLQAQWNKDLPTSTLKVGEKGKVEIVVNKLGIIMDYCLVPIAAVQAINDALKVIDTRALVTHKPVINPKAYFLTIGCCDFSVNDFNNIMTAYQKLSETP